MQAEGLTILIYKTKAHLHELLYNSYARKDSNPRPSEPESAGIFHNMLLYKGLEGYYKKRSRYVPGFLCLPWHYLAMWGELCAGSRLRNGRRKSVIWIWSYLGVSAGKNKIKVRSWLVDKIYIKIRI